MQSANSRKGDDPAGGWIFNGARDRGISIERHVWPVLVVIGRTLADEAKQMAFSFTTSAAWICPAAPPKEARRHSACVRLQSVVESARVDPRRNLIQLHLT